MAGVASRVTVGARVSICFGSSYSTLSGPPQIGLGGEQGERERERRRRRRGRRWRRRKGRARGGGGGRRTIVLRYRSPWLFRKPYQSLSWLPAAAAHPPIGAPLLDNEVSSGLVEVALDVRYNTE